MDLDRAREFYADRLGLRLLERTSFACVFAADSATLRVTAVQAVVPAPYTVLGWTVADIDAMVGKFGELGIDLLRFDELEQDSRAVWSAPDGGRVAWFHDPDGNILSVTESSS